MKRILFTEMSEEEYAKNAQFDKTLEVEDLSLDSESIYTFYANNGIELRPLKEDWFVFENKLHEKRYVWLFSEEILLSKRDLERIVREAKRILHEEAKQDDYYNILGALLRAAHLQTDYRLFEQLRKAWIDVI